MPALLVRSGEPLADHLYDVQQVVVQQVLGHEGFLLHCAACIQLYIGLRLELIECDWGDAVQGLGDTPGMDRLWSRCADTGTHLEHENAARDLQVGVVHSPGSVTLADRLLRPPRDNASRSETQNPLPILREHSRETYTFQQVSSTSGLRRQHLLTLRADLHLAA